MFYEYQSAYRPHHGTETALNKVVNDLRMAVDQGKLSMLVLLDLSAAFDTIDHKTLLSRLHCDFGLDGNVLNWFRSYLSDRHQSVSLSSCKSSSVQLTCGVPQGSVLGPVLFTMYTKQLGDVLKQNSIAHHLYADDTQLLDSFNSDSEQTSILNNMSAAIKNTKIWMDVNHLKLNEDKTEFIIFGPKIRLSNLNSTTLKIGDLDFSPSSNVKNLGVVLDSNLCLNKQVDDLCKKCFCHLRNIGSIRNLLTEDAAAALVRCLILSRIDYCNSLLTGLPQIQLNRLQRIQNVSARMVTKSTYKCHITPVLKTLHWLPISVRIDFKILNLTYQCVNRLAPDYLCDLIKPYIPNRRLRSESLNHLVVPKWRLSSFGQRTFSVAAADKWNKLPTQLRSVPTLAIFKSRLKTYLFQQYYGN